MSVLSKIKLSMLLVASPLALWLGFTELRTAVVERAPTSLSIASFAADYDGEAWLEVTGRVAAERAVVRETERGRYQVTVPVVEPGWTPDTPLHLLVTHSAATADEARRWVSEAAAEGKVRGLRRGGLAADSDRWQGLAMGEPNAHLNEGGEPNLAGGVFLSILFLLGALVSGAFAVSEIRGSLARSRSAR